VAGFIGAPATVRLPVAACLGVVAEDGTSAVHRHDRTVDEARGGGEKVSDDRRDLPRLADSAERVEAAHLLVDLLPVCEQSLVTLGGDRSQSDGVRANPERPVVDGARA
jgi:hypothetical protein